jgi:hypothetical protein
MPGSGGFPSANTSLLGGLLRLDALQPDGFNTRSLADHAGVAMEIAHALITPAVNLGYAVRANDDADVYRLTPIGRAGVIRRLAELRCKRRATAAPLDAFAPLDLLEAMLADLQNCELSGEERRAAFADAQSELRSCTAEFLALRDAASPDAHAFGERLDAARHALSAQAPQPPAGMTATVP